ncbi:MAG: type III-A CRISPR-associated protein Csm2 [Paenibacillus sp.]|nr:type III-A CRISPR-associated protein Csm2 [Paenibacillus sp.]
MSNYYNRQGASQGQQSASHPDLKFLEKGFLANQEYLLDSYAQKWAEFLAKARLNKAQIRRFYQDIKAIESRIGDDGESFQRNKASIVMLKAKAAYATAKSDSSVPKEFKKLIEASVNQAKQDLEQFKGFVQFFEALVAYHYPLAPKN